MRETFVSYSPSKFSIDITNLKYDGDNLKAESFPAFVHEYCHYIQDITHISSIFGFSLWLRDIVALTNLFSKGENRTIEIPLSSDETDEVYGKFRKFYLIYCGTGKLERTVAYDELIIENIKTEIIDIPLDKEVRTLAKNIITFKNNITEEYHFGLIPLQEIQAYYAQKLCEEHLGSKKIDIPSSLLMTFPYRLGDLIFSHFNVTASDEIKFLIADLCLDTVQAPKIFLSTIEALKDKEIEWERDKKLIFDIITTQEIAFSYSKETALKNIILDIEIWSRDAQRVYLSKALKWYLDTIRMSVVIKQTHMPTYYSNPFVENNIQDLLTLIRLFPPPIIFKDNKFHRYSDEQNPEKDKSNDEHFEAASSIRMHWVLYDLLTSRTVAEINEKCKCPLIDNCESKDAVGNEYNCATAPWLNIKENAETVCTYGMATHSFGLWQNDLDIRLD